MARGRQAKKQSGYKDKIAGCSNPELAQFILEWYEQAVARDDRLRFVYKRALESLLSHPHPIANPSEIQKLYGIGPTIRKRLERRIEEYRAAGGDKFNSFVTRTTEEVSQVFPQGISDTQRQPSASSQQPRPRSTRNEKPYVPSFKSGPYAMLIALFLDKMRPDSNGYLSRQEIVQLAQPYCSSPMDEGIHSPIQNAIKTLTGKGLVLKWSLPARFALTESGADLAERLWDCAERRSSAVLPPDDPKANQSLKNTPQEGLPRLPLTTNPSAFETFPLKVDTYQIILLVDVREVKNREERDFIVSRLKDLGVICEQRNLDLGDFIWVARTKVAHSVPDEIVLDYIVERKREDDLIASIADGRFLEQKVPKLWGETNTQCIKFRLGSSGITHGIYLVEKSETVDFRSVNPERFSAAIIQTQVIDDFHLRYTGGIEETVRFLANLTNTINLQYQKQTIWAGIMASPVHRRTYLSYLQQQSQQTGHSFHQSYGCFAQINSKSANMTLRDLFLKQLLTIRQLSVDKASMIIESFPTPFCLWRFYASLEGEREREDYFKEWTASQSQRKFGPTLSKRIYHLFRCTYDSESR